MPARLRQAGEHAIDGRKRFLHVAHSVRARSVHAAIGHDVQSLLERDDGFVWVDVTGGEVSLRKDFVDVCDAIVSNCKSLLLLHFPTNGYLTDKIVAATREIVRMRPEKLIITVSTDGDEATNDRIRGIEGVLAARIV